MNLPAPVPEPRPSTLSEAVSQLSDLLQLSASVLRSLPVSCDAAAASSSDDLLPCPYNPNHRIPPSSLFSHSLDCPSPLPSLDRALRYPFTLHSRHRPPPACSDLGSSSEISVSLENFGGYNAPANDFFYRDCSGPVTPSIPAPPSSFNLPEVLAKECTEFAAIEKENPPNPSVESIGFLPSEIWAIRNESESWGSRFPAAYSSRILRAILKFRGSNLKHWVVATSPRYAVIIDPAFGDHLILLLNLCFKAISREASRSLDSEENNKSEKKKKNATFHCPLLSQAMAWLAAQLSVLYGEIQGKIFAVDLLKESVSRSAMSASFLLPPGPAKTITPDDGGGGGSSTTISVSQVAAAVAALYERSFFQQKVDYLRNSHAMSAYQRNMEHKHVSDIANDERPKRPDYRPVVDHDGFLSQRAGDHRGDGKAKTREELLAEERDYKRRRTSYRGKKLKRNAVEVMRDLIEECMEEFKAAAGNNKDMKAKAPQDGRIRRASEEDHSHDDTISHESSGKPRDGESVRFYGDRRRSRNGNS
ncbi:hypothetical protein M569_08826 [Genlisea aurea]|uniref:CHHC U11-48K-type domain-containing protein n=1 Tax=Genlisea aurea TaxID=192259 RepID=S8DS61_9LAMI|nr:hypothetical protein M569_08826 [Genlisea aurea]